MTQSTVGDVKSVMSSSATSVGGPVTAISIESSFQSIPLIGMSVTKTFRISAAHQLPEHEGKCQYLHGHNYKIEVTYEGPIQVKKPNVGMVRDFDFLKDDFEALFSNWDHYVVLNKIMENPTAENMALTMLTKLRELDPKYVKVTVYETDDCSATAQVIR